MLTFEQFQQMVTQQWNISEGDLFIQTNDNYYQCGDKTWLISECRNNGDYVLMLRKGGGGILSYSHNSGWSIDCWGLATMLTWEEAQKMFLFPINMSKGIYYGTFKPKPFKRIK